jgi:lipopolysaccharide export LptBFGC system permease protein LptF
VRTLDRYIVRSFLFALLLWFVVLMALRVVTDLFVNMDEFAKLGLPFGELMTYIGSYYAYQSMLYVTELGGVIVVAAAAFTLAKMNQTNELVAMLASGVSLYRVVWPIVICAMLCCGLIVLDRELLIPPNAEKLSRVRDEFLNPGKFDIRAIADENGAVWYAPVFDPAEEEMQNVAVILRDRAHAKVAEVRSQRHETALARPGTLGGRRGWMLTRAILVPAGPAGTQWANAPMSDRIIARSGPDEIRQRLREGEGEAKLDLVLPDYGGMKLTGRFDRATGRITEPRFTFSIAGQSLATVTGKSAVYAAPEGGGPDWRWRLEDGRLFLPSDLTTEDLVLRRSSKWMDFLSVGQLTTLSRMKRVPDERSVRLLIQARATEPINNLIMLLLGLPFILSRERNIKASASLCLLMVGTFYAFIYICRYMDLPPMWAAWLPVLLFGPLAAVMIDSIKT